jgi:nitroreductase
MLDRAARVEDRQGTRVLDAIHARASIGRLKPDPIGREEIESLIDAAVQAPNHHITEPWRFFVLTGHAREELGAMQERLLVARKPEASAEERAVERAKPLRAPVIIAVTSDPGKDAVETAENLAATAAAIENMLLAAHALGLGAQWRTGPAAYSPDTVQWLGAPPGAAIVSFVYLGRPDMEPRLRRRTDATQKTTWRD